MQLIQWSDFEKVELRAGTILQALDFPEARKPAYKLQVDLANMVSAGQARRLRSITLKKNWSVNK